MENSKTPFSKFAGFVGSILTATDEKFQKVLDRFIVDQNFGQEDAKVFSKKMKEIFDSNKSKLSSLIDESIERALSKADIARSSEIKALQEKIKELESRIDEKDSSL